MWRSRCAASGRRFGGHLILTLTRWDASQPPVPSNLVLLMQNEAQKLATQGQGAFSEEVQQKIGARLQWARGVCANSWETFDHTGGPVPPSGVKTRKGAGGSVAASAAATSVGVVMGSGLWSVPAATTTTATTATAVAGLVVSFMLGYSFSRLAQNKL
jgi:hypothetical protein